jgi:hypothetical protein
MAILRSKLIDQETQEERPVTVFAEGGTIRLNGPTALLVEIVLVGGELIVYDFTHPVEMDDDDLEAEPEFGPFSEV